MAQKWRDSTFVGLDIAPVQTDLCALSAAEQMFSHEYPEGPDNASKSSWQDIANRVTWHIGDLYVVLINASLPNAHTYSY
jgi:hypothetical protein